MPGEPGRAPPPTAVEVWPSVAPFGEAGRISVSIIVPAFLCSSAGPPAPPARPQPVHRWWPNPTPSRNQAPRRRSHRSDVDAALGCHQMRSSATPTVASVTPNLLLLEIRRAFAAYSLPSRSPSSLGRRACSLACRPRPAVVPPPCDAAPTTAGRLLEAVLPAGAEPIRDDQCQECREGITRDASSAPLTVIVRGSRLRRRE